MSGSPLSPKVPDEVREHDFDGIQEYDNPLPRWWLYTFYGAIVFAFGYYFHYHIFKTGMSPLETYQAEMAADAKKKLAESQARGSISPEALLALAKDPAMLKTGSEEFTKTCVACHSAQGEGKIGPNLTDAYWLHGGSPKEIYETISKGVTNKGMPAWEPTLGNSKTIAVTAYVLSIRNKNIPGKAPQGEKVTLK
jgi:cytochrome c oxidase cbb3-type subunit III